ncbi:PKD domain-containing protein, partial [Zhouia amylolytica]|uniref:PKD domain-containing protein n=1 Tax=Zhouia amylolytica TaxID=376730 RepID=UPI0013797763
MKKFLLSKMPKYKSVNKLLLLAFMLLVNIGIGYSQFTSDQPDLRDPSLNCGFNCTSNNISIIEVYLVEVNTGQRLDELVTTCNTGDTYQVEVWAKYETNQNTDFDETRLFATFNIGDDSYEINQWLGTVFEANTTPMDIKVIDNVYTWECGDELEFTETLIVWEGNGNLDSSSSYNCKTYGKSQCSNDTSVFFAAPLAVQFDYIACNDGTQIVSDFTSTTNGGLEPYTYSWSFENGQPSNSSDPNPSGITFTSPGPHTVSLTVTDSQNPTVSNTFTQEITFPAQLTLSATVTEKACSTDTGAINLTVSGGTAPYTYSWSGPNSFTANNEDISNLTEAGTYTITVEDSFGCQVTDDFDITILDDADPIITAPTDKDVEGCDTDDITNGGLTALPYSPTSATITEAQYTAEGGSFVEDNVALITYKDEISGTCPIVVTRTFTITDNCGATAFDTQLINIDDTIPPVITGGGPEVVECDGSGNTAAYNAWLMSNGGATATDACDDDVSWSWVVLSTTDNCGGTLVRHIRFNATDNCNNTSWYETTFTIEDTTDPTFTVPADITIECDDDETDLSLTGDVTDEADNCDTTLDATYSD